MNLNLSGAEEERLNHLIFLFKKYYVYFGILHIQTLILFKKGPDNDQIVL